MAIETTSEQLIALNGLQQDASVIMVNLLKFREDGGEEHYQRYGREVAPYLERVGATIRFGGLRVTDPGYAAVPEHRAAALERGDLVATSTWSLAQTATTG